MEAVAPSQEAPADPAQRSAADFAIWSIVVLGALLVVLGIQAIIESPVFLVSIGGVLYLVYLALVRLYRTELARPSFKLKLKQPIGTKGLITITVQAGQRCPYCRDTLRGSMAIEMLTCGACQTVLHRDCLKELGSCPTHGCRNRRKKKS